jgi:hypothetical protein
MKKRKKSSTIRFKFSPSIPAEALFKALGFPPPPKPVEKPEPTQAGSSAPKNFSNT